MAHLESIEGRGGTLRPNGAGLYPAFGKRVFDFVAALLLAPVLAPAIAILWALAAAGGGGGFFIHQRVGRNGRSFGCVKIRTMRPDADHVLAAHLAASPDHAAEWSRNQKLRSDPRVTRLGRILRRTGLDELPQIWNVLRGEMSLVGPRPITTAELARYGELRFGYLSLRPGVTGPWQVHGRGDGCYSERIRMDHRYGREISLATDLALIGRTVSCMLSPAGC